MPYQKARNPISTNMSTIEAKRELDPLSHPKVRSESFNDVLISAKVTNDLTSTETLAVTSSVRLLEMHTVPCSSYSVSHSLMLCNYSAKDLEIYSTVPSQLAVALNCAGFLLM